MNRKSFSISLLILTLILVFSSCEKDKHERTFESNMDVELLLTTDRDGYFITPVLDYSFANIKNVNLNRDEIRKIQLTGSSLDVIGHFFAGDKFVVNITIDGVGTFESPLFYLNEDTNVFSIDNLNAPGFFNFMEQSFARMSNTGHFTISMNGNYNVINSQFSIKLFNDLKVTVRDK